MSIEQKAWAVVEKHNAEIKKAVQGRMTRQRLIMMALKNQDIDIEPLTLRTLGSMMWTRGDGSRYKEPGYIKVGDGRSRKLGRKYSSFKTLYPDDQALLDHVWESLKKTPRAKELGMLSGEFGASEKSPALRAGGVLWVKRKYGIEFGSMNRLKNDWVWYLKKPEETEEA